MDAAHDLGRTRSYQRNSLSLPNVHGEIGPAGEAFPPSADPAVQSIVPFEIVPADPVIAVREGVISRGKACDWYQLSFEELASWEVAFKQSGTTGLRARYRFPEIRGSSVPGG